MVTRPLFQGPGVRGEGTVERVKRQASGYAYTYDYAYGNEGEAEAKPYSSYGSYYSSCKPPFTH